MRIRLLLLCRALELTQRDEHRALAAVALDEQLDRRAKPREVLVAPLERERVRAFWIVPLVFEVAIFTNMKMLQAASVETVIVFRTLVPLITSWADAAFMGREAPSTRSALSLLAIVLSALGYAGTSSGGLRVDVWMWAITYLTVLAFEMVYVKHVRRAQFSAQFSRRNPLGAIPRTSL